MVYKEYCDGCEKEVVGWDNEYGQVMTVMIDIESDCNGSNGVSTGQRRFCSAKCAIKFLQSQVKKEDEWLDVWKRGKILGVAPVMSKKVNRRDI
jgi:hypothetical protein